MSWRKRRARLSLFHGLSGGGPRGVVPLSPYATEEHQVWLTKAVNVHAPEGKPTNDGLGNARITTSNGGKPKALMLAYLEKSGIDDHLCMVMSSGLDTDRGALHDLMGITSALGDEILSPSGIAHQLDPLALIDSAQSSERLYFCNGVDRLKLYDGTRYVDALLQEPAAAPTLTEGLAGNVNGDVQYQFTYYRSFDGAESPPSPIASISTTSKIITVSGFGAAGTLEEADKIRIYRTTDGGGIFLYLTEIAAGTGSYEDNTADSGLSIQECPTTSACHDLYPRLVAVHGGRTYFGDVTEGDTRIANRIYWTEPGSPSVVISTEWTDEIPGELRALVAVRDGLIAWNANQAFFVRNIGGGIHHVRPLGFPGCLGFRAAARVGGGVVWVSSDGCHMLSDDLGYTMLSSPHMDHVFREIPREFLQYAVVFPAERERKICFAVAEKGPEADTVLMFDTSTKAWWESKELNYTNGMTFVIQVADIAGRKRVICADGQAIVRDLFADRTTETSELEIASTDLTRARLKRFRYVDFWFTIQGPCVVSARVHVDFNKAVYAKTEFLSTGGEDLGDFDLGADELAPAERHRVRVPVGDCGNFIGVHLEVTPTRQPNVENVHSYVLDSIDITYQLKGVR